MLIVDLYFNQKARIVKIEGDKNFVLRLNNLGVKVGDIVALKRVAPLNDPIEIEVNGFLLALRKDNAKKIQVEIL